jgi:hypothetical protein
MLNQNQLTSDQTSCFISCNSALTCSYGGCCCNDTLLISLEAPTCPDIPTVVAESFAGSYATD